MAQPGNEFPGRTLLLHRAQRHLVPARLVGWDGAAQRLQDVVQKPAGVLGDSEESRTAPEQAGGKGAWTESGADRYVSRVTMAVGVNPWSAKAASTASNTRVSPGLGRRWVASQNASSPKPTEPMMSSARS